MLITLFVGMLILLWQQHKINKNIEIIVLHLAGVVKLKPADGTEGDG